MRSKSARRLRHALPRPALGLIALILALGPLACRRDDPAQKAGAPEAAEASAATPEDHQRTARGSPQAAEGPLRWRRSPPAEPDPAAKIIYRRALDLLVAGDRTAAAPLLAQLRREYPSSRFGARLLAPDARFGAVLAPLIAAGAGLATAAGLQREEPPAPAP